MGWGSVLGVLTHGNPFARFAGATAVGLGLLFAAWWVAYRWLPEGATRFSLGIVPRIDARQDETAATLLILTWNLAIGLGVIALASLFRVPGLPVAFLAPWLWIARFGVALGTNSFVLTVPEARVGPDLGVLATHVGIWEIAAYLLAAAALANAYLWRQRRLSERRLVRVRRLGGLALSRAEVACLVLAVGLLGWCAGYEAHQIALLQRLS